MALAFKGISKSQSLEDPVRCMDFEHEVGSSGDDRTWRDIGDLGKIIRNGICMIHGKEAVTCWLQEGLKHVEYPLWRQ